SASTRSATGEAARHATGHSTGSASGLVQLGDDGVAHLLELLLLMVVFVLLGGLVGVEPLDDVVALVQDGLLVVLGDLVLELLVLDSLAHGEGVALERVLGRDALLLLVVLGLVALGLVDHPLDVLLAETALVVGDGDLVLLVGALLHGGHVENAVGVDVEGHLDLGDSARSRRDAGQLELAQQVVVLGHGALAFNARLVVRVGGERLRLLGGDGGVPLDEGRHHAASGLDAERQWRHVQQQEVLHRLGLVAVQNGGLDGGAVGDGLVRVDRLVELLAAEEVLRDGGSGSLRKNLKNFKSLTCSSFWIFGIRVEPPTSTISLMDALSSLASRSDFSTGSRVPRNRSALSSSKRALKSIPSYRLSISMLAWAALLRVRLALSQAVRRRLTARLLSLMSFLYLRLNSWMKWFTILLSKSSPPRWVSPAVDFTSKIPSSIVRMDTSKVPPPRSKMSTFLSWPLFLSRPYAMAAAVGSLMMRSTFRPAMAPASLVCLCSLLHLCQDHRRDLFSKEAFSLTLKLNLNFWPSAIIDNSEGPMLHVLLYYRIIKLAPNESLCICNRITDEPFGIGKCNIAGSGSVALIVGNNFNLTVLEDTNTREF
uniref:Secreted protein n=1 Tax=Macrostomum lignano TaxID=282301 RepID=A0A1I8I9W5_9PLAT